MADFQIPEQSLANVMTETGEIIIAPYLAYVVLVVREKGWLSRGVAHEKNVPATADIALAWLLDNAQWPGKHPVPSRADREEARAVLAWGRELGGADGTLALTDYESNLRAAARREVVTSKTAGLVASLIVAYQRELERRKPNSSEHVGTVGERRLFLLRVRAIFYVSTDYGTMAKHVLVDPQGNVFAWKTNGDLVKGRLYIIRATITEHAIYEPKGRDGQPMPSVKQTVIKRCTVERTYTEDGELGGLPERELAELSAPKPKKSRKRSPAPENADAS
jgi:hypothetical protein